MTQVLVLPDQGASIAPVHKGYAVPDHFDLLLRGGTLVLSWGRRWVTIPRYRGWPALCVELGTRLERTTH